MLPIASEVDLIEDTIEELSEAAREKRGTDSVL